MQGGISHPRAVLDKVAAGATDGGDAAVGGRRRTLLVLAAVGGLRLEVTELEHEALMSGGHLEQIWIFILTCVNWLKMCLLPGDNNCPSKSIGLDFQKIGTSRIWAALGTFSLST